MMKDIIKPGIVLLIITVVAAGLLGAVNIATKDKIAEQETIAKENSMKEVLPEAKSFNNEIKNENKDYSVIKSYSEGLDENGNSVGYTFSATTKGFSTGLNLMIGITKDGVISGVDVLSHEETPGLGANAATDWKNQFSGKSGRLYVSKGDSAEEYEIKAITGATITSNAVTNAVNTAYDFYNNVIKNNGEAKNDFSDKVDSDSGATANQSESQTPSDLPNPPEPPTPPDLPNPPEPPIHHEQRHMNTAPNSRTGANGYNSENRGGVE